jgi:D-alanyl-D-alanine carboxypeptidase
MRAPFYVACIIAFSQTACERAPSAAVAPTAAPPTATISPDVARKIDAIARGALTHQHLAGLSLSVAKGGVVVYAHGYGYRDVAKRLPATADTIYNIASMSKQFTAASIMLLQQDGKLTIDDPLSKYLPQLPYAKRVTLRNLLNHTSGIPDYLDYIPDTGLTTPKILAVLEKVRVDSTPGTRYEYSNSNFILLGVVVTKASGMPFDRFVTQRIFRPLGLGSTSVGTAAKDLPNGALGYTVVSNRTTLADPQSAAQLDFPDGGVNSTVLDLATWDAALDSGRVVDPDLVRLMFTAGPHSSETTHGYGLGLGVDQTYGRVEISHQGEWTGYAGENVTFPDDRFAVILLSNTDGFNEELIARRIFALFFPLSPTQLAQETESALGENRAVTKVAKTLLAEVTQGSVDKALFAPGLAHDTSDASLAALSRELRNYGVQERFVFVGRDADTTSVTDTYRLYYPGAVVSYSVSVGADGKVNTFWFSRED